jgi:type IV pilus assembly protein PilP
MRRYQGYMAAVGFGLLLAGCSGDGLEDLREFTKNVHADRKPRIEPLPEVKPQEVFAYNPVQLTDPFAPQNIRPARAKTGAGGGIRPDENRRKEALEEFPLDALKMVGTLTRGQQTWAVIQAPDGTVHRTKIGDHMGQNFGIVTKISDEKIDLIELVQGASGDWVEREANLALTE